MKKRLLSFALASAMLLTLPGCGAPESGPKSVSDSYLVAKASYPEQAPFPDYMAYVDEKTGETDDDAYFDDRKAWLEEDRARSQSAVPASELAHFLTASVPEFLTGTTGNEVYSPINVYMALAMLAELTDGNSRAQILALLGEESVEALRDKASAVWNSVYRDDGSVASILASSVWLDEELEYVQKTMDTLAKTYYASSYRGDMGSEELNAALRGWLNEQTSGLLEEQVSNIETTPDIILALATTVYFRAKWSEEFAPDRTEPGEFVILSPDGGTIPCEFMKSSQTGTYYWGDNFSAIGKDLQNVGKMWFILPDSAEGVSVSNLLDDPTTMEFLLANGEWEDHKQLIVNLSLPKFDVDSTTDLKNGMLRLGITDVFDPYVSDFTPTSAVEGVSLSRAEHAARVTIDEEGVTAAAYTVLMEPGAAAPPKEEIDFILDRPFLFAITTDSGLPLFMGVVQNPA